MVKAINDGGENYSIGYSNEITLNTPTSFTASVSGSYIKCSWSKVAAATSYQILTCSTANGNYTVAKDIDDVNTTSCSVYYPASAGTTVYVKIRAVWYCPERAKQVFSSESTYKSVKF